MAEMGKYCKAYLAQDFRKFGAWTENLERLRPLEQDEDGQIEKAERRTLKDDDVLYLQENYTVTDGIFLDEYVVFDHVTAAWQEFCHTQLGFQIPAEVREAMEGS